MLYSCSPLHTQKQPSVVTAVSEQKNVAKEPSSAVRRGRREDRGSTGLSVRASVRLQDQLSLGAAPALPAWEFNQRRITADHPGEAPVLANVLCQALFPASQCPGCGQASWKYADRYMGGRRCFLLLHFSFRWRGETKKHSMSFYFCSSPCPFPA